MESAGFMNALSAASAAPVVRKRKRVTTAAKVVVYIIGMYFYCMVHV